MQHASGARPDPAHGYCTDDVARALRVDLLQAAELGWPAVAASAHRNLAFLSEAFVPATGRFRNFRAVGGAWLDDGGSEDCQGRAIRALGEVIRLSPEAAMASAAGRLLVEALPMADRLTALRARASALLGCVAADRGGAGAEVARTLRTLAERLDASFEACSDDSWPWPERVVTYENGLPAEALIVAGAHLADRRMLDAGLRTLDWLVRIQTAPAGHLSPVGNGWWPRGGIRSRYDQQPIEAAALLQAAEAALAATGEERYRHAAELAYEWFLGGNDVGVPVADPWRGACHDGLTPAGVNANQGAESTISWLLSVEGVRRVRRMAEPGRAQPGLPAS